jgi:hypothetical protein
VDPAGTLVEDYLALRGTDRRPPSCLPFHPHIEHRPSGRCLPAMAAVVQRLDGQITGLQRNYLRADGRGKASVVPNKVMLRVPRGSTVRLAPAAETLLVGEGIEMVLSAMLATCEHCWVTLSTSGLVALELPPLPLACEVVILADNDSSGAGLAAARAARRWIAEGRLVRIACPSIVGWDFNDVLRASAPRRSSR